jgi:ATP-dependent DNA helicase RecG
VTGRSHNGPTSPTSAFHAAVVRLQQPLEMAARSQFAALGKMPTFATDLAAACVPFASLAIPADVRSTVSAIATTFSAFGNAVVAKEDAAFREAILRALTLTHTWQEPTFVESLLARPLSTLGGVGPKRAEAFAGRGLRTVVDAMFYLPTRYDDRRALVEICDLEVGRRATFIGEVKSTDKQTHRAKGRYQKIFEAVVGDETGSVKLKWFRATGSIEKQLTRGAMFLITGDVKRYRFSKEIVHPELELIDTDGSKGEAADASTALEERALETIVPEYPTPEGLQPRMLRRVIQAAVLEYADLVEGCLPNDVIQARTLPAPGRALMRVHAPECEAELTRYEQFASPAHERLVLEELYLLQLGLVLRRASRAQVKGIAIDTTRERVCAAPRALPFTLTGAQERVWREVSRDMSEPHPMNRLLQGDVGSGKTAIALLAAVAASESGLQTALMAPTELLAEQHAKSLRAMTSANAKALGLRIGLLTASRSRVETNVVLESLAKGEIDLLIGTHALIQERVAFKSLGLAIVDEQHRFGVLQRAALASASLGAAEPHVLVMTATPIPRTLALTGYGDLELSVIDELPPGRSPTETLRMQAGDGERIMEMIRETVTRGEQVYVVYPLVEESEKLDLRSAIESSERIASAFSDLRVDVLHGRLDAPQRDKTMGRFARGEIDILVATTVIEVGVDVANASLMIIEHAERFGLAQLHQLRGRVGRGSAAGTCVLVSRGGGRDSRARLDAMLRTTDGFKIADADLEIRGPGEFLGTRQSGELADLRMADLVRDAHLVEVARDAAIVTVREDPGLANSPALLRAVEVHWGDRLALMKVG